MNYPHLNVEVSRGGITESKHVVHAVIVSSDGRVVDAWGDIKSAVYPRSAIKAMQALSFIEQGGAKHFNFTEAEIAICCASHNGEPEHVKTVQSMLEKTGFSEQDFECGCHWPMRANTSYDLAALGQKPNQLHNNCSGKHAGMLALAKLLGISQKGYIAIDHGVQQQIASTMAQMCEYDYDNTSWSPDGCSAPTWAIPLYNLGLAFAKFADPSGLEPERAKACATIFNAVVQNPFMVAGSERYCTDMMSLLAGKVFLKVGAEGVYVAAIPSLKLSIAMKCDDGAARAVESVMTALLDHLGVTDFVADSAMEPYRRVKLENWNKLNTGNITCVLP